ncbi:MAG TPA: hypothetical protein VFD41_05745 [Actinomycetales bacterium]|nr:hypothetical protein [Actinomycetales bacterium]
MTATAELLERGRDRVLALPGWAQALAVYLAARLLTALITDRVARFQAANGWTAAQPDYLDLAGIWDGDWYRKIAESGYPQPLPVGPDGQPVQSEWAFFPAFPLIVRVAGQVTGAEWRLAAPTVALLLGAAAAVVVHRLFADRAGHAVALAGVAVLAVFPSSPVLQYAYTESLALLCLALALLLLTRRRYLWALAPVAVLAMTRPVALPFALVVAAHLAARWRARRSDPLPGTQSVALVLLGLGSVAAGLTWPLMVGLATGDLGAYMQIQSAWRGAQDVVWLTPWWSMSQYLLGAWVGPLLLVAMVAGFVVVLASRRARVMGPDLTSWCAAYGLYLLAVVEPYTSIFRFLLLLFPLALVVAATVRARGHLLTWLAASLGLQLVWIVWLWRFTPPSDFPP